MDTRISGWCMATCLPDTKIPTSRNTILMHACIEYALNKLLNNNLKDHSCLFHSVMFQEHHVFILADFLFHSMNLFFVLDESVFIR